MPQPRQTGVGEIRHHRKGVSRLRQSSHGLLVVTEKHLICLSVSHRLTLMSKEGLGANGRSTDGDPARFPQLCQCHLFPVSQRMIRPAYAYHRATGQLPYRAR